VSRTAFVSFLVEGGQYIAAGAAVVAPFAAVVANANIAPAISRLNMLTLVRGGNTEPAATARPV